jgi:hypothetical protein
MHCGGSVAPPSRQLSSTIHGAPVSCILQLPSAWSRVVLTPSLFVVPPSFGLWPPAPLFEQNWILPVSVGVGWGRRCGGRRGGGPKGWGRGKSPITCKNREKNNAKNPMTCKNRAKIAKPRRKSPTTCKNREKAIHKICHERPKSRKIDRKSPKSGKTFQGTPLERFPRLRGFSHPKQRTHPQTARKPLVFKGIFAQKSLKNQWFSKVFATFLEGFGGGSKKL